MKHIVFFTSSFVCSFIIACLFFLLVFWAQGCDNRILRNKVRILEEQQQVQQVQQTRNELLLKKLAQGKEQ